MTQPLKIIFDNQAKLVDKYIEAGKQGPYPAGLITKEEQAFIRELFGYLEEEIFEAYELIENMGIKLETTQPNQITKKEVEAHLITFNEEIADTLAFWVEIFIYTNITADTLKEYYEVMFEQMDLGALLDKDNTINMVFSFAKNIIALSNRVNPRIIQSQAHNLRYHHRDLDIPRNFNVGGNFISTGIVKLSEHYIFHSIKHLKVARNCLKKKYWRENGEEPNYDKFHNNLIEAFLNYSVFLLANGYETSEQLVDIFMYKNNINLNRIKDKW